MKHILNRFFLLVATLFVFALVVVPARGATLIDTDSISIGTSTPYDSAGELTLQGDAHISGHLSVGANASINAPSIIEPSSTYYSLISNQEFVTDMSSTYVEGITNNIILNPTAAPVAFTWTMDSYLHTKSGNAQDFPGIGGLFTGVRHRGTGTVSSARGVASYNQLSNTGTITKLTAYDASIINTAAGTINTAIGYVVVSPINSGGGTITNNYGMFVHDQSSAGSAQSYNIYSVGPTSKNFFGGDVFIGGSDLNLGSGSATTTLTSSGGNLGVATTIPGVMLGVKGSGIFEGFLTASYISATSTTATSTIGYGLTVDSDTLVVDANGGKVGIATSTIPTTNNVVISIGAGTASTSVSISGGGAAGSSIILKSSDGNGCGELIFTRGAANLDAFVSAGFKVIACPK